MKKRPLWISACLLSLACGAGVLAQAPSPPADGVPVFWSAAQMKETDERLAGRVDPSPGVNMAGARLTSTANAIYRTGPSQAEVHEKQTDFIVVRGGEGTIIVGGRMLGGKLSRPDELRGDSIEGGTSYKVGAGDSLYIPVNAPHQFIVEKGKHLALTIIKIDPRP